MTIPEVVADPREADYLEVMTRAVFQTGLRWSAIASNWPAYRHAFDAFDPQRVASYGESDLARIRETPGVLRSDRKIKATIANAREMCALAARYGSFRAYLRSFGSYDKAARDIQKRFGFMGAMNAWYLLFLTGEPVPRFEQWVTTIPGDHPRMREMVARARAAGRSSEMPAAE